MTKSNVEKGTDYEKFVQGVYEAILRAEGVQNIDVQHNIEVVGKSGCAHQIDVYWEFQLAGQTYKTAIECKAFDQNVPIGRVRDFYGVLLDVPNLNGVFATLVAYQSGADRYARHYGISLKVVREPTDADWEGLIKDVHVNVIVPEVRITNIDPQIPESFRRTLTGPLNLQWSGMTNEPMIYDPSGAPKMSYNDLLDQLPSRGADAVNVKKVFSLPDHILRTKGTDLPIEGLEITYDIRIHKMGVSVFGEDLVRAIVKDVESGEFRFVGQ